jgi:hypothetical protein
MGDAQVALNVIIGMILINDNNAIVLFNFRASHSFVAANFMQKRNGLIDCAKKVIRG